MNLISLSALSQAQVQSIWSRVGAPDRASAANVAWSFEGNGIRTRTTFIRAFRELGMPYTELPNLLKTAERVRDLAGYLDPFFDLYVIRDTDHERLAQFADATSRPVVNAMSAGGHPCEVLTDAYYVNQAFSGIRRARICLWGPTTNVFRSWHELARVFGTPITQVCDAEFHASIPFVDFLAAAPPAADVVITDAWPGNADHSAMALTIEQLQAMGSPAFLPTPPFTIGREVLFDPLDYPGFAGYQQKALLLAVHKAILQIAIED